MTGENGNANDIFARVALGGALNVEGLESNRCVAVEENLSEEEAVVTESDQRQVTVFWHA